MLALTVVRLRALGLPFLVVPLSPALPRSSRVTPAVRLLPTCSSKALRGLTAVEWPWPLLFLCPQRDLTLRDFFPPSPAAPAEYAAVFEPMLRSSPQLAHALQVGSRGVSF